MPGALIVRSRPALIVDGSKLPVSRLLSAGCSSQRPMRAKLEAITLSSPVCRGGFSTARFEPASLQFADVDHDCCCEFDPKRRARSRLHQSESLLAR